MIVYRAKRNFWFTLYDVITGSTTFAVLEGQLFMVHGLHFLPGMQGISPEDIDYHYEEVNL